jgi:peptidoglycan hydrolase-like protein with peptidoglycan-binding domain
MKRLAVLLVVALSLTIAGGGQAHPHRHRRSASVVKKPTKRHRARRPARTTAPLVSSRDELVLSPALLRQIQRNLVDGGYLRGTADGRLTPRTRHALAEFQREYHMVGTGVLDRATAEALIGRDAISAYTLASATQ